MQEYFGLYDLPVAEKFKHSTKTMAIMTPSAMVFYGMLGRRVTEDDNVTIRLNLSIPGVPQLEYNPKFIDKIHPDTLAILCYIECMRMVLHHCTKRVNEPLDKNYLASNLVLATKQINRLIAGNPSLLNVANLFPKLADFRSIFPADFDEQRDVFLERIFRYLRQDEKRTKKAMDGYGDSSAPNTPRRGMSQEEKQKANGEQDAMRDHFSQETMEENSKEWKPNPIVDNTVANEVNKMPISAWGDLPGGLLKDILTSNERMVDPRAALRNFARTVFDTVFWFSRNKMAKHLEDEYIGIIPGKRFAMKSKILIAIDSSGSVSDTDLKFSCQCVKDFLGQAEVYYCFWDTKCYDIKRLKRVTPNMTFKAEGRGGTDPSCIFNKLKADKSLKFDGIIMVTDGEFSCRKPTTFNTNRIFMIKTNDKAPIPSWLNPKFTMDLKKTYKYLEKNKG